MHTSHVLPPCPTVGVEATEDDHIRCGSAEGQRTHAMEKGDVSDAFGGKEDVHVSKDCVSARGVPSLPPALLQPPRRAFACVSRLTLLGTVHVELPCMKPNILAALRVPLVLILGAKPFRPGQGLCACMRAGILRLGVVGILVLGLLRPRRFATPRL